MHNELGRFCREKQYADALDTLLKENDILYEREKILPIEHVDNQYTNKVDFLIEGKVLVDLKAKPCVTKSDYQQMQRYLYASKLKLGLIVNFQARDLHPIRVIRINS